MIITLSFDLTEYASPVPYIYILIPIRAFNKMERKQTIFFFQIGYREYRISLNAIMSATQNICTLFRRTILRLTFNNSRAIQCQNVSCILYNIT